VLANPEKRSKRVPWAQVGGVDVAHIDPEGEWNSMSGVGRFIGVDGTGDNGTAGFGGSGYQMEGVCYSEPG
jgi:hypothetical protein